MKLPRLFLKLIQRIIALAGLKQAQEDPWQTCLNAPRERGLLKGNKSSSFVVVEIEEGVDGLTILVIFLMNMLGSKRKWAMILKP